MLPNDPARVAGRGPSTAPLERDPSRSDVLEESGRALMGALSVVRQTYAQAYRPLYACVYRFAATQLGGDLAAADEVATETLGRGWVHITSFRKEDRPHAPAGNLRGWLLTIAHRVCIDVARRRGMTLPLQEEVATSRSASGVTVEYDSRGRADDLSKAGDDGPLDPEQLLRRLQLLLNQLQPIVQELADSLPAFQGGRGRPTRGQRLSVALRDLGAGCEKTLEAFRRA